MAGLGDGPADVAQLVPHGPRAGAGRAGHDRFDPLAVLAYDYTVLEAGRKVAKSHTATAFTWERTDKAEALRAAAGL